MDPPWQSRTLPYNCPFLFPSVEIRLALLSDHSPNLFLLIKSWNVQSYLDACFLEDGDKQNFIMSVLQMRKLKFKGQVGSPMSQCCRGWQGMHCNSILAICESKCHRGLPFPPQKVLETGPEVFSVKRYAFPHFPRSEQLTSGGPRPKSRFSASKSGVPPPSPPCSGSQTAEQSQLE